MDIKVISNWGGTRWDWKSGNLSSLSKQVWTWRLVMLIIRSWQFFRKSSIFLCDDGKLEIFKKKKKRVYNNWKELETWDERWSELACVKLDQWKTKLNMNIKWLHWFMITEYYSRNDSTWPFGWGCGTIIVLRECSE